MNTSRYIKAYSMCHACVTLAVLVFLDILNFEVILKYHQKKYYKK